MKKRDNYFILIEGQLIEVTPEVYEVYYKGVRKERHFMYDLKAGRSRINRDTGEKVMLPGLEESFERMQEINIQFVDKTQNVEDEVLKKIRLEKLYEALHTLRSDEAEIIWYLYFERVSEVQIAKHYGVPRTTLQAKKYRILKKLKRMISE